MKDVFPAVLGFVAPFVLVAIFGYGMYQGDKVYIARVKELQAIQQRNAELCHNQTSEFEWREFNGILYCSDNGKWVKLETIK